MNVSTLRCSSRAIHCRCICRGLRRGSACGPKDDPKRQRGDAAGGGVPPGEGSGRLVDRGAGMECCGRHCGRLRGGRAGRPMSGCRGFAGNWRETTLIGRRKRTVDAEMVASTAFRLPGTPAFRPGRRGGWRCWFAPRSRCRRRFSRRRVENPTGPARPGRRGLLRRVASADGPACERRLEIFREGESERRPIRAIVEQRPGRRQAGGRGRSGNDKKE